ncbi:MAG: tetratricopeptide repeat protein [Firmicutes bacterium]|nr:tetratricopeptide repeat protein [Bacillota bacterium]
MKNELEIKKLERIIIDSPNDIQAHFKLGLYHDENQNFREAINELEKAALLDPSNLRIHYELGLVYSKTSQYEQAIRSWRKLVDTDGDLSLDNFVNIPVVHTAAAARSWERFRESPQDSAVKSYTLGFANIILCKWDKAIEDFKDTLAFNSSIESGNFYKGYCHFQKREYQIAASDFLSELTIRPRHVQCLYYSGLAYMEMGNLTQAVQQFYRTLKEMPRHVKSHFQLARAFATQGNHAKTEEILYKTLEIYPGFIPAYLELGKTAEQQFQLDKATSFYEKAVELDDNCRTAHLQLGLINKNLGKLDLAVKHLTRAINLDPSDADALYYFGLIHIQRNQYEKAAEKLQNAVKVQPLHPYAHYSLGLAFHKLGRLDKAIAEYINSLKLNPRDAIAQNALGDAFAEKGEFEKSLECYRYALEINPRDITAQYNIGNIYMKLKDFKNAAESFKTAAEMDLSGNYKNYFNIVNMLEKDMTDDAMHLLETTSAGRVLQEQDLPSHSCINHILLSTIKYAKRKAQSGQFSEALGLSLESMISVMAEAADNRFDNKEGHSSRVGEMAYLLATAMGVDEENATLLKHAGLLHDIGKLYIPETIINADTGDLSEDERDMLRDHSHYSYEMIKQIPFLEDCSEAVLYHHERYDGKGFPEGLEGDDIPIGAQIISIADFWDNLIKQNNYTPAQAIDSIIKLKGKKFSPEVTDTFLTAVDRLILI